MGAIHNYVKCDRLQRIFQCHWNLFIIIEFRSQFGKVYVIDNADTAHLVATYNSSTTNGQAVNIDISSIADNSAIRIAFEFDDNNGWNWYWLIDNLKLDGIMAGAPGMVTNPNPAHLATNVPLNGSLSWDFGADTEFYDLWFGTVGNMTEVVSGEHRCNRQL